MKRILTAVIAVLFIGSFAPRAEAQIATGPILVLQEVVLAQLASTAQKLDELRADIKDMGKIPERDPAFWAKISEHFRDDGYIRNIDPPKNIDVVIDKGMDEAFDSLPTPINPEARGLVDRWHFANQVAQVNMRRDGNARNLKSETAFMYLSHFIDRQGGPKETIEPRISDEDVYAGWITNDDRRAYERYLKGSRQFEVAFSTASFFTDAYDTLGTVGTVNKIEKFRHLLAAISYDKGIDLGDGLNELSVIFNGAEDSAMAISRIESSLNQAAKQEGCNIQAANKCANNIRTALEVAIGFGAFGLPAILGAVGVEVIKYHIDIGWRVIDRAEWAALIRTYHARMSSRVMRNWGLL